MAVEHINETDTLNQGRLKINAILDQSNDSSEKVDAYQQQLNQGIASAEQIAEEAGEEAKQIATNAGQQANITANEAKGIAQNANTKSDNAVATANQNKQEFDTLRNDFDDLVAEAGDSNPEIVQARTDTTGVKQSTLANRLTIDFGDRLTNADAIELISGEAIVKKMMDFVGKTAGNTATNPHAYYSDYTANTLKKPSATWNEVSQSDYNKLASRDDSGVSTGSTAAGIIPQQMAKHGVVATAKALSPQLFAQMDDEESVQYVKDNFVSFSSTVRAKASSPNNKNFKAAIYMPATDSWSTLTQNDATEYTDFTVQINDNQYITDDGYIYILYYSDSSNGVTPANIDVDYAGTALSIMINAQQVLKASGFVDQEQLSKKANAQDLTTHINDDENPHGVTAEQVGLGDVSNFNVASQAEAEAGTAADKYMTPQRTKQAIEKLRPITDSGWVRLSLNSGYSHVDGLELEIRKVGNHVELRGCVTISNPASPQGQIANIPSDLRPTKQLASMQPYRSSAVGVDNLVYVYSNGNLSIIRNAPSGGPYDQLFVNMQWELG